MQPLGVAKFDGTPIEHVEVGVRRDGIGNGGRVAVSAEVDNSDLRHIPVLLRGRPEHGCRARIHCRDQTAFGKPIADNQGVSFPLAEHATYLEAARWLCYRALWLREQGKPHTSLASMSKWWPPTIAKDAIEAAMRIHGNLGYATEFPLQQRFRDVMAYFVADGTAEIQKRVIAKDILARRSTSF